MVFAPRIAVERFELPPVFRVGLAVVLVVVGMAAWLHHTSWVPRPTRPAVWPLFTSWGVPMAFGASLLLCAGLRGRPAAVAVGPVIVLCVPPLGLGLTMLYRALLGSPLAYIVALASLTILFQFAVIALHGLAVCDRQWSFAVVGLLGALVIPTADYLGQRQTLVRHLTRAIDATTHGERFALAEHTDFEWDRVYVFGWYSHPRQIQATLEIDWEDPLVRSVENSEAHHLFVFVADGRVVGAAELFHGEGFCHKFAHGEWARDAAVFEVDASGDPCLVYKPMGKRDEIRSRVLRARPRHGRLRSVRWHGEALEARVTAGACEVTLRTAPNDRFLDPWRVTALDGCPPSADRLLPPGRDEFSGLHDFDDVLGTLTEAP
ncbi:MAG: hypothetical protein RIT81_25310 [Deltaproteobacteria bacterium]